MLYVLVPVLVHVLLDGSGHDSAEIDGTVERHATSAPSKQPVPAPRHSTTKPSTKPEFHLELGDASRTRKTIEQLPKPTQEAQSPSKSKIPVKTDPKLGDDLEFVPLESSEGRTIGPQPVSRTIKHVTREYTDGELTKETVGQKRRVLPSDAVKADDLTKITVSSRTEMTTKTMEMPEIERTERVVRTVISSSGYGDAESALRSLQEQLTRSEIGETASWTAANEQWEAQYSQDTSPGSGNGGGVDTFASNNNNNNNNNKNDGSSRHDMHSDTDSDGSPQPRRRSPSKRRTLGSSSGSDVALHEGAELSPLEDDQGTALSQLTFCISNVHTPLNPPR